ncbi:LysR family transcriptional regulator [Pyxidicoccus fallax]|nr:LysR family transcriptional regulator [Pyxidicoccus fallax]
MSTFVRVAETRNFTRAARQLRTTASAVSKSVARLEQRLGVRLLDRTTRRVSLTQEGALYYERCVRILGEVNDAEAEISQSLTRPRGRLRVTTTTILGLRVLVPQLRRFRERFPEVQLELELEDAVVDLIAGSYDVAIRMGEPGDPRLKARRLAPIRHVLCASPDYLRKRGVPRTPSQLAEHDCIHCRLPSGRIEPWAFATAQEAAPVRVPQSLVFNHLEAVMMVAMDGMGIARVPEVAATPALASGKLVPVLREHMVEQGSVWLLWQPGRERLPRLRAFIDFVSPLFR